MADRDLETIAREWWAAGYGDSFDEIDDIVRHHREAVPALIKALADAVDGAASGKKLAYIGTTVIEDLLGSSELFGADEVVVILRSAQLTHDELVSVLSGVYPELLVHVDLKGLAGDLLSNEEIAWLTSRAAPGRSDYL
jgi:hypothetical protein